MFQESCVMDIRFSVMSGVGALTPKCWDQQSGIRWKWFEIWQPNWLCGQENIFFRRPNVKIAVLSFNWPQHDHSNSLFFLFFSCIINPLILRLQWLPFGQPLLNILRSRCRMSEWYTLNDFWCYYLVWTVQLHQIIALKFAPSFPHWLVIKFTALALLHVHDKTPPSLQDSWNSIQYSWKLILEYDRNLMDDRMKFLFQCACVCAKICK